VNLHAKLDYKCGIRKGIVPIVNADEYLMQFGFRDLFCIPMLCRWIYKINSYLICHAKLLISKILSVLQLVSIFEQVQEYAFTYVTISRRRKVSQIERTRIQSCQFFNQFSRKMFSFFFPKVDRLSRGHRNWKNANSNGNLISRDQHVVGSRRYTP